MSVALGLSRADVRVHSHFKEYSILKTLEPGLILLAPTGLCNLLRHHPNAKGTKIILSFRLIRTLLAPTGPSIQQIPAPKQSPVSADRV